MGVLAGIENGGKQFWKYKIHATNEKAPCVFRED
jgi:hypothetical protein